MGRRLLVLVVVSCVSSSVPVANAAGGVAPNLLSVAVSVMPSSATSTTVPTKPVKPVKTTVPVKPKNKNVASAIGTTVPVIAAVTTGSNIASGSAGSNVAVVLPVEVPGLISVCVNKSTSVLRDTADNSCSSGSEVKVEWLDTGMSPKICVNNNNREMTLAQDGKCSTKNSAVADVTVNKQILACADEKTGVLRYRASGVCGANTDPVTWELKDQGVARNVSDAVKTAGIQIISLIPTTGAAGDGSGSTKTVTTSPTTNTASVTTTATTTTTIAVTTTVPTATTSTTTSTSSSTTTTTVASRAVGSFAGYLGGTCPDGSGIPWYWGSGGQARAGGCSAAASIAPISTGGSGSSESAATTTTVAPVVVPGTPATPTGVSGNTQVTVTVAAGSGGTPTSYTITQSTTSGGTYTTGCTVTGASGSCVVTGLTNGTAYFFKTTATNTSGTSGLSTASSSVTPATVPGAPTIGTATIASATSVTVACTTPASNGGATITTYTFTSSPAGGTATLTSATCSTTTVTGLTTGTAYTFTVKATNSAGTSVASAASNSVTPVATCATGGTCVVGNTGPGGGIVFYVASTGFNCGSGFTSTGSPTGGLCLYLEADSSDLAETPWCNLQNVITASSFSEAIGAGYANTVLMTTNSNCASGLGYSARSVSTGGKSDWYLPSNDELNQMCKWQRGQSTSAATQATLCNGTGTLNSGSGASLFSSTRDYRTSNQQIGGNAIWNAFVQSFSTGNRGGDLSKGNSERSRAIRAFGL